MRCSTTTTRLRNFLIRGFAPDDRRSRSSALPITAKSRAARRGGACIVSHRPIADWPRQLAGDPQLRRRSASLDASGDFPHRNIDVLRRRGFLSLAVPQQYGGPGASLAELQQAIAAIAWGEPATALIVCMQYLHHLRLAENTHWAEPLRQRVFDDALTNGGLINSLRVEPDLGSPARGGLPQTIASRNSRGWLD